MLIVPRLGSIGTLTFLPSTTEGTPLLQIWLCIYWIVIVCVAIPDFLLQLVVNLIIDTRKKGIGNAQHFRWMRRAAKKGRVMSEKGCVHSKCQ